MEIINIPNILLVIIVSKYDLKTVTWSFEASPGVFDNPPDLRLHSGSRTL